MSEPVLELKEVTLRRGRFSLEGVNLSLAGGEILALLGRTGAGKTLLLESAAGFCAPSGGQVLFRGQEVRRIRLHRRNIGYLYQEYSLFPHLTAAQNIGYGLRVRHMRRDEVHRQVQQLAARFGLERVLDQYPGTLSGGEQQRVALARALAPRPALLLLDEPFSALDPVTKKQLHGLLRQIRQEFGCAVLFVTHDFTEAQDLADRVGVLAGGRLCGIAPAADLYRASWPAPALEFLGLAEQKRGETAHDADTAV